jgi:hypothetical protein
VEARGDGELRARVDSSILMFGVQSAQKGDSNLETDAQLLTH